MGRGRCRWQVTSPAHRKVRTKRTRSDAAGPRGSDRKWAKRSPARRYSVSLFRQIAPVFANLRSGDVITLGFTPSHPYFLPNDHVIGDSIRFDPIADSNGNLNFVIILSNDQFYGDKWGSLNGGGLRL